GAWSATSRLRVALGGELGEAGDAEVGQFEQHRRDTGLRQVARVERLGGDIEAREAARDVGRRQVVIGLGKGARDLLGRARAEDAPAGGGQRLDQDHRAERDPLLVAGKGRRRRVRSGGTWAARGISWWRLRRRASAYSVVRNMQSSVSASSLLGRRICWHAAGIDVRRANADIGD